MPPRTPPFDDDPTLPALTLYRVGKVVSASLDLDTTLAAIVDAAHELTAAESTAIMVQDDQDHLVIRIGRGPVESLVGERVPVGAGVVGRALLEARPILIDDMQNEPGRARLDLDDASGLRSYLAAPLVWRGDTLGLVTVGSSRPGVFTEQHRGLVAELAEQAAAAVTHARAYAEEMARREQLEVLNRALAQAQQRLVQIEKLTAIGQLAHGIAHEVNTPLGVIISNLAVLSAYTDSLTSIALEARGAASALREGSPSDLVAERLEAALAASDLDYTLEDLPALITESTSGANRIGEIVRSVALFARSGSEQMLAVNIEEILESSLTLAWNELKTHAQVERDFGGVPPAVGSASELTQVFVHLLLNAAQSIEGRGGKISISTSHADKQIVVRIADNGRGIPAENLPRVFEPFFTTRPVGEGSGLGLPLCHGIITRHGGTIDLQSVRGGGTTVTVRLVKA